MSNGWRDLRGMPLDGWPGVEVINASPQGIRCATARSRRSSQPRAATIPRRPLPGLLRPTEAAGPKGELGFLGVGGGSWVGATTSDCVEQSDTNERGCWVIGHFCRRVGVVCVAAEPAPHSKVEKSGTVWHGLVPSWHRVSDKKLNTIPVKSLAVWQFPEREGVVCVVVREVASTRSTAAISRNSRSST